MTAQTKSIQRLGVACMLAAILSGILGGLWEFAHPILISFDSFGTGSATQRWGYALLSVIRSAGFLAGLFALYRIGTRRGWVVTIVMVLATLGGLFFTAVWLYMAAVRHFTIIYVLGGLWYQWIAPVVLGIASLRWRRISVWVSVWAIVVGIVNSQIFVLFAAPVALIIQGVVWVVLGYMIYVSAGSAQAQVA